MKKYIRELLDDLTKKPDPPPVAGTDAAPRDVVPQDLENQDLSTDSEEMVRQLDQQAQDAEIRETLE